MAILCTNLLKALALQGYGESFRTEKRSSLLQKSENHFGIKVLLSWLRSRGKANTYINAKEGFEK